MKKMRLLGAFLTTAVALGTDGIAASLSLDAEFEAALGESMILEKRGLELAPNGYTPLEVDCPSTRPAIRLANRLAPQETDWLKQRRQNTIEPMKDLFKRLDIDGFDAVKYIDNHKSDIANIPNIGISCSGGGWRALLNGAGALAAFDSRTKNATSKGHVGGVLQSSTYLSGLSGGSWLVGSIYMNNFSTVQTLLDNQAQESQSGGLWQFQRSILEGPVHGVIELARYFANIYSAVSNKESLRFNTTITDYWGRALSYQLINATQGGPGYTWSSIVETPVFMNAQAPMPLVVADGRNPGETIISINTTVYEFTPWEMGSYDPTLYGFVPIKYTGSQFFGGKLQNDRCVAGFDNAGYVMGTSSSLFNQVVLQFPSVQGVPSALKKAIESVLNRIGNKEEDIADWSPNPFHGWLPGSNLNANSRQLTLVDGGEDSENIPLHPLLQPQRNVDVIFAVDSSADTAKPGANWPNGTALIATYTRSQDKKMANGTSFPAIPDSNTFVNLGLNQRPTFFGCNSKNTSSPTPLIVYLANAPYIYTSNVSTFQPEYNKPQQYAIVENGYDVVTMGNSSVDPDWPACLGCAILSRSLERTKTKIPSACTQCFDTYCWNGTTKPEQPSSPYNPQLILANLKPNTTGSVHAHKKSAAASVSAPMALRVLWAFAFSASLL